MPIKNYTTSVAEDKTVGEIMGLLAAKGARQIYISYDTSGRPEGISFLVAIKSASGEDPGVPVPFKLPCNFDGVFRALKSSYRDRHAQARFERSPESRAQSRRVAWRIIKDWIDAQMALIEAEQASLAQVFLPYAVVHGQGTEGREITVFDKFLEQVSHQRALPAGTPAQEAQ
jgi:hypothetical protein